MRRVACRSLRSGITRGVVCWALLHAMPCMAQTNAVPPSPARLAPHVGGSPTRASDPSSEPGTMALARFLLERGKERFNRGILARRREELEGAFEILSLGRALGLAPAFSINA